MRLVGLAVERNEGEPESGHHQSAERAGRRLLRNGKVGAGGQTRTDPGGMMSRIGVISGGRVLRAGLRESMVVIGVVLVIAGQPAGVAGHCVMGPLVRQSCDRRSDHQPAGKRRDEPSRQRSDRHGFRVT